jgi:hypothetical protein
VKLQAISEGKPENIPPALLNRPVLSQFEQPFMDAFNECNDGRNWTMGGPTRIPPSEITAFFINHNITDPDEREEYIAMIRHLDAEYLKIYAAKAKK